MAKEKTIQIPLISFEEQLWNIIDTTSAVEDEFKMQTVKDIVSESKSEGLVSNQVAYMTKKSVSDVVWNLYDNGTPCEDYCKDLSDKIWKNLLKWEKSKSKSK